MIITKKALSRRTVLRGIGVSLALPYLDAMVPALSAVTTKPAQRFGFFYMPNGVALNHTGAMRSTTPAATSTLTPPPPISRDLRPRYAPTGAGGAGGAAGSGGGAGVVAAEAASHPRFRCSWM